MPLPGRGLALLLLLPVIACAPDVPGARLPVETLVVGNVRITAEVAASAEARAQGLMFRETLPEDHGMLFIYPDEAPLTFWMRNTPLPLSIAFADGGGRIVHIAPMEPLSDAAIPSGQPARYALARRVACQADRRRAGAGYQAGRCHSGARQSIGARVQRL